MTDINTVLSKTILLLKQTKNGKKLLGFLSNFFYYLNSDNRIKAIDDYIDTSISEPYSVIDSIETYLQFRKIAVKMANDRLKLMDSLSTRFVVLDPFDYGHFTSKEIVEISKSFPSYENELNIEFLVSLDLLCERLGFQADIPDEYGSLIFTKVDFETYHRLKNFLFSPYVLVSKSVILVEESHLEEAEAQYEKEAYLDNIEEE